MISRSLLQTPFSCHWSFEAANCEKLKIVTRVLETTARDSQGLLSLNRELIRLTSLMAGWVEKLTSYDDLSLILGTTLALVFSFAKWASPVSLTHPLLLGKQAEVARVRKSGESAVYRNYGTGSMGTVSEEGITSSPLIQFPISFLVGQLRKYKSSVTS
jgi:hypothetical protein